MLNWIIQFSISNKGIIGMLTLGLIFWGLTSLSRLPIDAVPDITNNQVQVITYSPSLAPQEIEKLITFPIEMGLANIPEIKEMRSISRFGLSVVTIVFDEKSEIYWARQQVGERLKSITNQIPAGLGIPELGPVSTGLSEIFQYTINPKKGFENRYSAMEIRTLQDWLVRRQLLGTEGVADVSSFGGFLKQYEIAIDPERLRTMGLSLTEVFEMVSKSNQNSGGSYLAKGPEAWYIRSEGLVESLDDIGEIFLKSTDNGLPVKVKDVAEVRFGHAIRYGALTRNDDGETVGGIVLMLKGANSNQVITRVKERMAKIEKMLPKGLEINVYLDRSDLISRTIQTVSKNLIEGALIVIFVLVLFLGNWRAGLLVASVIPLAMLFALGMMDLFGVSGNLMSLGAIDFGLIVDGAVIIVEATLHHLLLFRPNQTLSQKEMDDEVFHSASKIRNSAAFGEIIILIVYLPILALVGIEGKMFKPMAQTVSFAILGAFILSLTYVPMASAIFLSKKIQVKTTLSDRILEKINAFYQKVLEKVMQNGVVIISLTLGLFVFSVWTFSGLGGVFIPSLDEGDFAVETRLLPGSSMDKTIEVSLHAAKLLQAKFPEVKEVIGKIGTAEIPTDPMGFEACDLMVLLKNRDEWPNPDLSKNDLADAMKKELEIIPGVHFGFQQPIQMRFNELMTGAKQDVAIKIFGEDLDELARQANHLGHLIESLSGLEDLYIETITGLPQMLVKINREKLAFYKLHVDDVNKAVETAFAGAATGSVYEGEKRFDCVVRLKGESKSSIQDLGKLYIRNPDGVMVPLLQVASVSFQLGPNQIQREDGKRRVIVAFNIRGRDVTSLVHEIESILNKQLSLPSGYSYTIGGEFRNFEEAKDRLLVAVPIALVLILFLLYFTFGSLAQGLLIFSAIPLSAIGGIWALWLRDMPFSISAGVGFIALFGVAVLNGIVLMGEFNHLKINQNLNLSEIIKQGTATRLRPILMTASVASLGFLPMALSQSAGAEVQKPLATVVIGGLVSATFLTLFILPILYSLSVSGFGRKKGVLVGIFLIGYIFNGKSQLNMTMEKSVQKALEVNKGLQAKKQQTEAQRQLKAEAYDLGKANALFQYGQTNSAYQDNYLSLNQTIPFPTVLKRQRDLAGAKEVYLQSLETISQKELTRLVQDDYLLLLKYLEKEEMLLRMDSLHQQAIRILEKRLELGDVNHIELMLGQNLAYETESKKAINRGKIMEFQDRFKSWLQIQGDIIPEKPGQEWMEKPNNRSTISITHPVLRAAKSQVSIFQEQKKLEKAKRLPDLMVGYFNQSLTGMGSDDQFYPSSRRFQGIQAGLQFPIWTKPQKARIQAAESLSKAAEAEWSDLNINLSKEKMALENQLIAAHEAYQILLNKEFPNARNMQTQALKALSAGQISWLELFQYLKRTMETEDRLIESRYQIYLLKNQLDYYHVSQ